MFSLSFSLVSSNRTTCVESFKVRLNGGEGILGRTTEEERADLVPLPEDFPKVGHREGVGDVSLPRRSFFFFPQFTIPFGGTRTVADNLFCQ